MPKAFKAEFILGIIGFILSVNAFFFAFIFGIVAIDSLSVWNSNNMIAVLAFGIILLIVTIICGFIGIALLNKNNKSGGTLLVIAGGLSFIILFLICSGLSAPASFEDKTDALVGIILFLLNAIPATALLLLGGFLALFRKRTLPVTAEYPMTAAYYPYPVQPYYSQPWPQTPPHPQPQSHPQPQTKPQHVPSYPKHPYAPTTYPSQSNKTHHQPSAPHEHR